MSNQVTIWYSDGVKMDYPSIADAESAITDAVIGSDFAITVDAVESDKWPNLAINWSINIVGAE